MKILYALLLVSLFIVSCSPSRSGGLFSKKTAREKYEDKVVKDSGKSNPVVNKWLNAGEYSLNHPLGVASSYSEAGKFLLNDASASSFSIPIRRGEKLSVSLLKNDTATFTVYMDLWQAGDSLSGTAPSFIKAADTSLNLLEYAAGKDEKLLVRFQHALGSAGKYTFKITTGPSLAFPIASSVKSNIGSFWGDGRDAGARKHEGIDIFAPKHSPAVAVASGLITGVSESMLGGKVVFLQPEGTEYNVYYAHLDSQLVQQGQKVNEGDVIGLTGNTGNAKYTASHLHFGIYAYGGAIDPIYFIKKVQVNDRKLPALPFQKMVVGNKKARLLSDLVSGKGEALAVNLPVTINGITDSYYRITLDDGRKGYIALSALRKQ